MLSPLLAAASFDTWPFVVLPAKLLNCLIKILVSFYYVLNRVKPYQYFAQKYQKEELELINAVYPNKPLPVGEYIKIVE